MNTGHYIQMMRRDMPRLGCGIHKIIVCIYGPNAEGPEKAPAGSGLAGGYPITGAVKDPASCENLEISPEQSQV